MHFCSWLIQLNRSYKYNRNFARTGIPTLNGHISKPVALREKWKKINSNYFSILGLDRWFRNFPQYIFYHFWLYMRPFSVFIIFIFASVISVSFAQNRPKSDISGALRPIHYITLKAFAMASGDGTKYKTCFGGPRMILHAL